MSEKLFLEDSYLKESDARIMSLLENGIILDRTIFYARSGGQPGDKGVISTSQGKIEIMDTVYDENRSDIVHIPQEGTDISHLIQGEEVRLEIDWGHRYSVMRMHSALHLLSVVLPYPVTGGQMSATESRLDFDMPDMTLTKEEISDKLNALISGGHSVSMEWISDEELDAQPELVKTMSVKPPRGSGFVRLVRMGDVDLQPCGGTHVANSAEIGEMIISKIEKKGKQNRRVRLRFADV